MTLDDLAAWLAALQIAASPDLVAAPVDVVAQQDGDVFYVFTGGPAAAAALACRAIPGNAPIRRPIPIAAPGPKVRDWDRKAAAAARRWFVEECARLGWTPHFDASAYDALSAERERRLAAVTPASTATAMIVGEAMGLTPAETRMLAGDGSC